MAAAEEGEEKEKSNDTPYHQMNGKYNTGCLGILKSVNNLSLLNIKRLRFTSIH